jgi:phosphocarrier protein FPr
MVGLVLVSHSRELAASLARFVQQVSTARIPVACAAGVGSTGAELGTDALAIAEAIRSVSGPEGVLVLMDLGSAVLATESALELLPEDALAGVRLCPAPLVEGAIAAAVRIAVGDDLEAVYREAAQALAPKADHLGAPARGLPHAATGLPGSAAGDADAGEPYQEATATLRNAHGLHLRPAARLVRAAARFQAEVLVGNPRSGKPPVSAASLNAIATLGLAQGEQIVFRARGPEAREALAALQGLAAARFGEEPEAAPAALPPAAPPSGDPQGTLQGIPVSEGFAAGPVLFLARAILQPSERPPGAPDEEWAALLEALRRERAVLDQERQEVSARVGTQRGSLFEAFQLILQDCAVLDPAKEEIFTRRRNAEQALAGGIRGVAERYRDLADPYARQRAEDILDLGQRLLRRLRGSGEQALPAEKAQPVLLAAEELSPAAAARLDARVILGVLTVRGGPTSHSAVLVRALGIPCIAGLPGSLLRLPAGTLAAMDGGAGRVWVEPDRPNLARIEAGRAEWLRRKAAAAAVCLQPAISRDGRRFFVEANIAGVADAQPAVEQGAEGIGVLRTEFLFLNRTRPPSENEQLEALQAIAGHLQGRPLTARTLDVGGDKAVPYLAMPVEANPYLGVRGVRLCLRREDLFQSQLRAVLRAAALSDVRLLFPMVTTLEELDGALAQLDRAQADLARSGIPHRWPIPVGMMVETPSAALLIDAFLERVDFVSVGTNDLTQYSLAAERGNPALAGYEDALHPAVLTLIRQVAAAAARRGKTAAVCGEIAGDPVAIPVLAGLGVSSFSLNASGIPRVKETLRRLDAAAAVGWAEDLLRCGTAGEVRRRAAGYYDALPGGEA